MVDMFIDNKKREILLLTVLLAIQVLIYAPNVGKGFITDDFTWLGNVVKNGEVDFVRPFRFTNGFFRPLVSASFGVQYLLHGLRPGPYGWFNLVFHLLNIFLIFMLVSSLIPFKPYALAAAVLFALNTKAPLMAVGWISGRTTLMCTFFVLLSLILFFKAQNSRKYLYYLPIQLTYLAALLSKETAAAAPLFIFFYYLFKYRPVSGQILTAIKKTMVFVFPLVVYAVLRFNSNAMTPLDAPDFYRYSPKPGMLAINLVEYTCRACLIGIFILVCFLTVRALSPKTGRGKIITSRETLAFGIAWFISFLLPILALPARSDLYVYLPQLGLIIILLPVIYGLWEQLHRQSRLNKIALLLPVVMLLIVSHVHLVYHMMESGQRGQASYRFTRQVIGMVSALPHGSRVWVVDKCDNPGQSPFYTVSYGFDAMLKLYLPQKKLKGSLVNDTFVKRLGIAAMEKDGIVYYWTEEKLLRSKPHRLRARKLRLKK